MAESVLVTGGTGYVAGWCIAELLQRGYTDRTTVRSLGKEEGVRSATATVVDPGDRLSFVVADLTSDDGWDEAMAGIDYVLRGRRNRHSTEKARRLLGWQSRPAAEVVVDCARSLIERKAV